MVTIKKLRLKGFKSFAKATDIPFGENFNVIIGPNGSGKSNVMDSLCFVLGKTSAKSLRAERSANLIFNGGIKKNPLKEAQVDIFFDNSKKEFPIKDKEVKFSRIVRQSGASIYKINDETSTRQQVVDLLSAANIDPDGHNIIMQGDIVRFTEMRSNERREVIEEVSGISVYEDKKFKALNELDKVDKKLNDADIILVERETHLKELKKDRDQALRYNQLQEELKSNKATRINLQVKDKDTKKQELDKKISENNNLDKLNKNLLYIKKEIDSSKKEIEGINKEIEDKGEVEQQKLNKEIEDIKTNLIRLESREETLRNELNKISNRKKQLSKEVIDIDSRIADLSQEKIRLGKRKNLLDNEEKLVNSKLDKIKGKFNITTQKDFEDLDLKIEENQGELDKLNEEKLTLLRRRDKLEFEGEAINVEDNEKNIIRVKSLRNEFRDTLDELKKQLNQEDKLTSELNTARGNLVKNNEEFSRLNARQMFMKERSINSSSINEILNLKEKGIHGTIADLGKVNSKYAMALKVAAGGRINSVVVDDDLIAQKCIRHLKDKRMGVVRFLPLNKIKGYTSEAARQLASLNGVKGLAKDLVKYDVKYENVFSNIFGSTLVVESIDVARNIGIGKMRMVTLEGDILETSGAMMGGYRKKGGIGFKEKEMDKDLSNLEREVSRLRNLVKELEDKRFDNEERLGDLKNRKAELEGDIIKFEKISNVKDLGELKKRKDSLAGEVSNLDKGILNLDKKIKDLDNEVINLKKNKERLREEAREDKNIKDLDELENERKRIINELAEVNSNLKSYDVQVNDIFNREKSKSGQIIIQLNKETEEFTKELEEVSNNLKESKKLLKDKEILEKKFYSNFKILFNKRNKLNEVVNKKDNKIVRVEENIKTIENRRNNFNLEKAKIIGELEGLNKEFEEFAGAKLKRGNSLEELKYEIKKIEGKIYSIGNVNLRALEVYDKIGKEYEKLLDKVQVLKDEKEDVMEMMDEIDSKKKDIFMKTFNSINKDFQRIFATLSQKGKAHLELEDMEDLFNNGINIRVRLTGNKFLDIKSLSGGEKTLTALALIFAIQEYSPASFYLLDEVDAALDKQNSVLLTRLIQKYATNAQYIVISHNDHVITDADQIYGVSMQDSVSKIVSLKI